MKNKIYVLAKPIITSNPVFFEKAPAEEIEFEVYFDSIKTNKLHFHDYKYGLNSVFESTNEILNMYRLSSFSLINLLMFIKANNYKFFNGFFNDDPTHYSVQVPQYSFKVNDKWYIGTLDPVNISIPHLNSKILSMEIVIKDTDDSYTLNKTYTNINDYEEDFGRLFPDISDEDKNQSFFIDIKKYFDKFDMIYRMDKYYKSNDNDDDEAEKYCLSVYNTRTNKDEEIIYSFKTVKENNITYHYIYIHDEYHREYRSLSEFLSDYILGKGFMNRFFDRIKENAFELLAQYIGRYPTSGAFRKYTVKRTDKDMIDDSVTIEFNWDNMNNRVIINYTSGYKTYYNPSIEDFADLFDTSSNTEFENALVDLLNLFERMKEIDMRYYFRNKHIDAYHKNKYPTIAIIGSTKYAKQFRTSSQYFQVLGYVVLTTFIYEGIDGKPCSQAMQDMFEELGCQRIDMADEVFVINVDGYIGDSTKKELEYAKSIGKPISYYTEKF